ncbi:hypothetical protein AZE42_12207 [Rhizopogon vesiculosus]|uniref:Uncharacterized protein n=1 Tax=Rhizopogon vesiculosus TaxID=180088 RepID=A0A1J8Q1C9_9AGAM|nr:hypothetical protein AZE42_12207 [Rhizopogon vesiculosus]
MSVALVGLENWPDGDDDKVQSPVWYATRRIPCFDTNRHKQNEYIYYLSGSSRACGLWNIDELALLIFYTDKSRADTPNPSCVEQRRY